MARLQRTASEPSCGQRCCPPDRPAPHSLRSPTRCDARACVRIARPPYASCRNVRDTAGDNVNVTGAQVLAILLKCFPTRCRTQHSNGATASSLRTESPPALQSAHKCHRRAVHGHPAQSQLALRNALCDRSRANFPDNLPTVNGAKNTRSSFSVTVYGAPRTRTTRPSGCTNRECFPGHDMLKNRPENEDVSSPLQHA